MRINRKCQAVELAHGIDAGRANIGLSVFRVPQLEIATASLRAGSSELELHDPFRLSYTGHILAHMERSPINFLIRTHGFWAHKEPLVWPG